MSASASRSSSQSAGEVREIPLTRGFVAIVDAADHPWLVQWSWHYNSRYAWRTIQNDVGQSIKLGLHREIMGAKRGELVDHINGDTMDNRRSNLRFVTAAQNQHNRHKTRGNSAFKGVSRVHNKQRYRATIVLAGEQYRLGNFATELEAAVAYDLAAIEKFGDFARLNFPEADRAEISRLREKEQGLLSQLEELRAHLRKAVLGEV